MENHVIFTRTNSASKKMTAAHCFRRQKTKSQIWQNTVTAPYAFWKTCQQPHCSQASRQHALTYLINRASRTCKIPDLHEQICKGARPSATACDAPDKTQVQRYSVPGPLGDRLHFTQAWVHMFWAFGGMQELIKSASIRTCCLKGLQSGSRKLHRKELAWGC